jgi:hypothetical protein
MFELKKLSRQGIDGALAKAERYRLLNEPWEAESICRDVLAIDPDNQTALIILILAITDRYVQERSGSVKEPRALLGRLHGEYERTYYAGIIAERRAKALLASHTPGSAPAVYEQLRTAMRHYEEAEALRAPGNDDAILRWNTCARLIMRFEHLQPGTEEPAQHFLE